MEVDIPQVVNKACLVKIHTMAEVAAVNIELAANNHMAITSSSMVVANSSNFDRILIRN